MVFCYYLVSVVFECFCGVGCFLFSIRVMFASAGWVFNSWVLASLDLLSCLVLWFKVDFY